MAVKRLSTRRQRWRYVACDYATSVFAFFIFNVCRFYLLADDASSGFLPGEGCREFLLSQKLILEQIFIPVGMLGIYWLSGYYNLPFGKSRLQELITTFFSALVNAALIYLLLLINDGTGRRVINYELILTLIGSLFLIPYLGRIVITSLANARFRKHNWEFRTLIVGNTAEARATGRRLSDARSRMVVRIVGYLAVPGEQSAADGERVFPLEDVEEVCRREEIDQLVIAGSLSNESWVLTLLFRLFHLDIPIKIAPGTLSYVTSAIRLQDIYGEPYVDLTAPVISESSKNMKRTMDVAISVLVLLLLSPLFLFIAVIIKADSRGPVIYSQERIGLRQRSFRIFKFRSMRVDAESDGPALSEENDPRITRVGRWMRKYRVDELPQFWNVLKGEMSIVGPRPERRYFIDRIMRKAPYYTLVYQVRPGITSWGMVKYGYARNVEEMVERTRYDLIYMSNMSLFVDMKILIYTVKTIFTGKGM